MLYTHAAAALAALAIGSVGGWKVGRWSSAQQLAQAHTQAETLRADVAQATVDHLTRTIAAQQKAVTHAKQTAQAQAADAADARTALQRLRERAIRSGCAAGPAPDGGPPAASAPVVHAELFQRLGEAAEQLAAIADERGRAGAACEAIANPTQ
jgi:hypothetical protein